MKYQWIFFKEANRKIEFVTINADACWTLWDAESYLNRYFTNKAIFCVKVEDATSEMMNLVSIDCLNAYLKDY